MFGYIRPVQGELKVRELERFKACYCGLCQTLGKKFGLAARFILNYELVFLAMLLWDPEESPVICRKRCIASPLRKKRCCAGNDALSACAGYTVILTWWKLQDTIIDESFLRSVPQRLVSLFLKRAYKKAAREFPDFDDNIRKEIKSLSEYEKSAEPSLDGAADKFAKILCAVVDEKAPDSGRRPLIELLYHLGRWIYIIDAYDDYKNDVKAGRYNPVAVRYPPDEGRISAEDKEQLKTTLTHSNNLLCLAFELLPENAWTDVIQNMIYLSMPDVCRRVIDGKWPIKPGKQSKEADGKLI